jgi:simple sugar transport system ATP-binding protein
LRDSLNSFNIKGCGPETYAKQVSGGNQQKIILAREFDRNPHLIIAVQPTRGLDISAIEFVRKELIRQRDRGAAILLISTELDEILALSDRIEVIYEGEFTGSIKGHDVDPMHIGLQMAGKSGIRHPPGFYRARDCDVI